MKRLIAMMLLSVLFISALAGCGTGATQTQYQRDTQAVALTENQQKVANSIWASKSLWSGCRDLSIYSHGGKYYFAVNKVISQSWVEGFDGQKRLTSTCKRYAYSIEDGVIKDNLSLADAGVTSVGRCVSQVVFQDGDTAEIHWALITQLVAEVNF